MQITKTVNFVQQSCYLCGMDFWMPDWFKQRCKDDKTAFFCPLGHGQVYSQSTADEMRKKLEAEKRNTAWWREHSDRADKRADTAERRANGYKGALTQAKKRVGNGVCPCCNRTFSNVARHMATQHPDYTDAPA